MGDFILFRINSYLNPSYDLIYNYSYPIHLPKGWTLPDNEQIDSIGPYAGSTTYISEFSPIPGGHHNNGTLYETTRGYWWGSDSYDNQVRYYLYYTNSKMYTRNGGRSFGFYIRCVQAS